MNTTYTDYLTKSFTVENTVEARARHAQSIFEEIASNPDALLDPLACANLLTWVVTGETKFVTADVIRERGRSFVQKTYYVISHPTIKLSENA